MARQSTRFLHALQLFVLGLITLFSSVAIAAATPTEDLVNQGFDQLNAGQTNAALKIWEQAEKQYRQVGDTIGISGSLVTLHSRNHRQ